VPRPFSNSAGDAGDVDVFQSIFLYLSLCIPKSCRIHLNNHKHHPRRVPSHQTAQTLSIHPHPLHRQAHQARSHSLRRPVSRPIIQPRLPPLLRLPQIRWMSMFRMNHHLLTPLRLDRRLYSPVHSGWTFPDHPLCPTDSIMIDLRSNNKSQGLGMGTDMIQLEINLRVMQWEHNLLELHRLLVLLR
jgi:hypothetical protein